jgi:hypothetical protein
VEEQSVWSALPNGYGKHEVIHEEGRRRLGGYWDSTHEAPSHGWPGGSSGQAVTDVLRNARHRTVYYDTDMPRRMRDWIQFVRRDPAAHGAPWRAAHSDMAARYGDDLRAMATAMAPGAAESKTGALVGLGAAVLLKSAAGDLAGAAVLVGRFREYYGL